MVQSMLYSGFDKIVKIFTLMFRELIDQIIKKLDTIPIAVKNNKIDSLGGSRANKIDKIPAQSKNYKKFAKARYLKQPTFLSSASNGILCIKDYSD